VRNFIICIIRQILQRWPNQGEWNVHCCTKSSKLLSGNMNRWVHFRRFFQKAASPSNTRNEFPLAAYTIQTLHLWNKLSRSESCTFHSQSCRKVSFQFKCRFLCTSFPTASRSFIMDLERFERKFLTWRPRHRWKTVDEGVRSDFISSLL
jgi:hypothetical protein